MTFRRRIERAHLAVTQGLKIDRDEIFSIMAFAPIDDALAVGGSSGWRSEAGRTYPIQQALAVR